MWPYGGLFEINSDLGGFTLEVSLQDPQLPFFSESASEGFWLPTVSDRTIHFSMSLKFAGQDEPFLHQLPTLPSQQSKKASSKRHLSECPRQNAIASCGEGRQTRCCGVASGCRCFRLRGGSRWPWPRSWKSWNLASELVIKFKLTKSFAWGCLPLPKHYRAAYDTL